MIRLLAPLFAAAVLCAALPAAAQRPAEVAYAEGVLAYEAEEWERAAQLFAEVQEVDPEHPSAGHYRGLALIALEQYEDAVDALEGAARAAPEEGVVQRDLGIAYLLMGNLAFAARQLGQAVRAEPGSAEGRYYLGVALARQGDCVVAARHLAEARRLDAAVTQETRYLEGLCHIRHGDMEEVREAVDPIIRAPVSTPLVEASRRFVRIALRSEGIETAVFSGRAGLSVGYDSNPTLAAREATHYHSFSPVVQLDATVRAVANEHHTLAGSISAYRSFNFPDAHASDYNYTLVTGSAYYRLRGHGGGARHELHLGYDFALDLFDGGQPLTDQHHLYSETHGGRIAWTIRQSPELQSRLTVLVRSGTFSLLRRNNVGVLVGFGQTAAVAGRSLLLMVEGTVRLEEAHSPDYDVVAPGILVAATWSAPWSLTVSAWVAYEHEDHPSSSDGRVDDMVAASLSVERPIVPHLSIALSWMHTESFSTVERFDYGRDIVAATLWGRI